MQRHRRFWGALLAAVMLVSTVPAAHAAVTDGSLNPETCIGAEFDESVYDAVGHISDAKNGKFDWPSSGTVLLKAAGTNWSVSKCKGITIPAGLVVDIYQYHANDDREYVYELIGHYDTTDGSAYTIGSSSSTSRIDFSTLSLHNQKVSLRMAPGKVNFFGPADCDPNATARPLP